MKIKVLNLSPDFGPLTIYRSDDQGELVPALPTHEHSAYVELDTTGASKTYNKIILNFCKAGTKQVVLTKAIDAISNSLYDLVFQGFEQTSKRKINIVNGQQEVTVSPNLRVNIRRIF